MRRHIISLLAVVTACACVPAPSIYYRPDASVGRRVNVTTASISPADGWEIESGKAKVRVRVTRDAIEVAVLVPPGSHAIFATPTIRVTSNGRDEILTMETLSYTEDKTRALRTVSATELLEGGSVSFAFGKDAPRDYSAWLNLGTPLAAECELHLPDLSVDGEIYSYGPVRFSKKLGAGLFFING